MNLSEVKSILKDLEQVRFELPNGNLVPKHFHVTEVGKVSKHFIDCGDVIRKEEVVNFQLWSATDYDHRLPPQKLLSIIELSQKKLGLQNTDIEVEYQGETIQKFGLAFNGKNFLLTIKQTDCLAKDKCGIPTSQPKAKLATLNQESCCSPDGTCC